MLEFTEAAGHEVLCACEMCVYVCVCMHTCAQAQTRFSVVEVHFLDQLLIEVHEPRRINNSSSESSIPWLNISLGEKNGKENQKFLSNYFIRMCSHLHILCVHRSLKFIGLFFHPHLSLARISGFAQAETSSERVVISCKNSAQEKAELSPRPHLKSCPVPILSMTSLVVCHQRRHPGPQSLFSLP